MKTLIHNNDYVATPSHNIFLGDCTTVGYFGKDGDSTLILIKTPIPIFPITKTRDHLFKPEHFNSPGAVSLRVMSSCITGLLGDQMCECHEDMVHYLSQINMSGEGVFIYLSQEGMGRGLKLKLIDHYMQQGISSTGAEVRKMTFEEAVANIIPNEPFDIRSYEFIGDIFTTLGLDKLTFKWLGSNERGMKFAKQSGIKLFVT